MKNRLWLLAVLTILSSSAYSQIAVAKIVGKNASKYKLGYGLFTYYDVPLTEEGNSSFRVELLDGAYFAAKEEANGDRGYVSIKLGYKKIFSETRTGFYIEPQAGYCRAVLTNGGISKNYGDGIALAGELGYSLEVGERGHSLNVGVKYETDRAGADYTISSVGLRLSYRFNMFGRKDE
jgi:hypothetical protein